MREEEGEEGGLAVDQNSSDLEESLTSRVGRTRCAIASRGAS
jgi:hypothetical protein